MISCDVAIVGAGAAGLGAAWRLASTSRSVVLIDARDRLGGRAHTVTTREGDPIDLGCEWLHSGDVNPLVPLFESLGIEIDRTKPKWDEQDGNRGFSPEQQREFAEAFDAFEERLAEAADQGRDDAASRYFEPNGRWNALIDAVSSYYNGTEYDRVSVLDYARYVDTGVNWRVRRGYGAALSAMAGSVTCRLGVRVEAIEDRPNGLILRSAGGDLEARHVVLSVPTTVLAGGRLILPSRFDAKVEAANGLPLGLANKVFFRLREPERFSVEGHLFGRIDTAATGSYQLRPFGQPLIEGFFGGRHAAALEAEGPGAMTAFALEELRGLFGAELIRSIEPECETAWGQDPFALGSYSHALPGHAEARQVLAQQVDDRVTWAGEATHAQAFSTAHGAWETGLRAAEEILALR
ncbi:flavin monoamine oxidase family protein [Aureimonas sp. AU40]|uniref:flavin monoamine oxidase family protein n=1 Tax=Aureimonas sp. AU40 TaxID=1637747 RepID=UPI00078506D6|nr:NAD(P)/FAD-dependent oxidoreductase [Aureimonas sp. AU40]